MEPNFDITPQKEASKSQYLRRQFLITAPAVSRRDVDLKGKTAIITGSNTGLGLETASQLLDLGLSKLIMAVRTVPKAEAARRRLLSGRTPGSCEIEIWRLDLESYDSIDKFAARARTLPRLDIAILNAGLYKISEGFSATGYEESIQINYLSNILLMILLLPALKESAEKAPGRLVLVSSDTAGWAAFNEKKSQPLLPVFKQKVAKWDMGERYGTSKLLGQLFVTELCKSVLPGTVTISMCNPGFCYGSELSREAKGTVGGALFGVFNRVLGKPLNIGARSIVHAAVSFGQEVHGQYVEDGKLRPCVTSFCLKD
jgi:NAD(P)-dependent dehydrogenase (short-subunit alcohol dehydrogenase family)